MFRSFAIIVALALVAGCATPKPDIAHPHAPLSAQDVQAIRAVDSAYVAAWLRDDTVAVLATLEPDAVLMPAGQHPLVDTASIRSFWWPKDGSHTKILTFARTLDEVDGRGDVAWMRGTDTLTFTYAKGTAAATTLTSRSMSLALLRRQSNGAWRISRMMWGNRAR